MHGRERAMYFDIKVHPFGVDLRARFWNSVNERQWLRFVNAQSPSSPPLEGGFGWRRIDQADPRRISDTAITSPALAATNSARSAPRMECASST
jgi:hypothetical protein